MSKPFSQQMIISFLRGLSPKRKTACNFLGFLAIIIFSIAFFTTSCSPKYSQGKLLYEAQCANCHGPTGEGLKSLYPPLNNVPYLEENLTKVPCIIRYGLNEELKIRERTYTTPMEGLPELSDIEITNIVNYIISSWYKDKQYISLDDVKIQIETCK